MNKTTKFICINGMGIALFVALSMCLRVPVFENYYLCLGYIVMTVYCYKFGVTSGLIVGVFGTMLYCLLINGLRGMPGWVVGNIVIAIELGLIFKITKKLKKPLLETIIAAIITVETTAIGILVAKSLVEMMLYSQPFLLRISNNIYAFIADIVVIIMSLPICRIMEKQKISI